MSSARRPKSNKKRYKHRINKQKYKRKSKGFWRRIENNVPDIFFTNINQVFRENILEKARQAEGKGTWKVVPKDSCEVYKDRRKRESNRQKQEINDDSSYRTDNQFVVEERARKKPRRKLQRRKGNAKTKQTKRRNRKTSRSNYSNSMSTSCSTISEMEH